MAQGQTPARTLADRALDVQAIQLEILARNTALQAGLERGERLSIEAYSRWVQTRLQDLCRAMAAVCGDLNTIAVQSARHIEEETE